MTDETKCEWCRDKINNRRFVVVAGMTFCGIGCCIEEVFSRIDCLESTDDD